MVAAVAVGALGGCKARHAPSQPIAFNHALHLTVQLDDGPLTCAACHPGAERGSHAGLPSLARCLGCHMRPQGDPPSRNEHLVRDAAAAGGPFRWIQVTRNPSHIYFAHSAHVTVAGFTCDRCHQDVERWQTPPTLPDKNLTSMDACLSCHRRYGAPTVCATCHQ
jgi:hypothetical protein